MEKDQFFDISGADKSHKKKMLQRIQKEKQEKNDKKKQEKSCIMIQKMIRAFLLITKTKKEINLRLKKRFSDLNILKNTIKTPNFCLPLQILNDFLRDFNFLCFRLHLNQAKHLIDILSPLGEWLDKSIQTENLQNNIYYAFFNSLLFGSEERLCRDLLRYPRINKQKYEFFKDRSFINIKQFLRNIFHYFDNWPPTIIGAISKIFDTQTLIQLSKSKESHDNLLYILQLFNDFFKAYNITNLLRKITQQYLLCSIMKKNEFDQNLLDLIKIQAFPITLFYSIDQLKLQKQSKQQKQQLYDDYAYFQTQFVINVLSIPRIHSHIIKVQEDLNIQFDQFNWKNLYQNFLYQSLKNPLSYENKEQLMAHFKGEKERLLHLYGNSIVILESIVKKNKNKGQNNVLIHKINDFFALFKIISITGDFITPQMLGQMNNSSNDNFEFKDLSQKINTLLQRDFALELFDIIFCLDKQSKQQLYINPETCCFLAEIYSKLIIKCQKNDQSRYIILNIVNSLAFHNKMQVQLFQFIQDEFELKSILQNKISKQNQYNYLSVFVIFLISYYNSLLITEQSEFLESNPLNVKDTKQLILMMIELISAFMSNNKQNYEQEQYDILKYIADIGSKLLKLLYEFNQITNFLENKYWLLDQNLINSIINQVYDNNFNLISIVHYMPFSVPFDQRILILNKLIEDSHQKNNMNIKMMIRRNNLFEDGFEAFKQVKMINLKAKLCVIYIDEFGNTEEGIDAGGIFKEFINDLSKIVFNPNYGMFKLTEQNQQLYPNPLSYQYLGADHLEIFYFLGSVVGRAIYDKILIQTLFSTFFLRKMIGKQNFLAEIKTLDPEIYKNLTFLKNYKGDAKDLSLTFSVNNSTGKEVELIPYGKNIEVTSDNKLKYIYLVANYKLNEEIKEQCVNFVNGLQRVIQPEWLQMFDEVEIQMVISGQLKEGIDVIDLKKNTKYIQYYPNDNLIKEFWKIIEKLAFKDQHMLIKFITGCERPPLLGFSDLNPPFTIVKVDSCKDTKLPSSATCFNRLHLPSYSNSKILKEKLMLAITQGQGFHIN